LTDPPKPVNISPRLRRALLAFIAVAAYSAEVATSATKAGSYGVFGEREYNPRVLHVSIRMYILPPESVQLARVIETCPETVSPMPP
jgi:hypothetical protein